VSLRLRRHRQFTSLWFSGLAYHSLVRDVQFFRWLWYRGSVLDNTFCQLLLDYWIIALYCAVSPSRWSFLLRFFSHFKLPSLFDDSSGWLVSFPQKSGLAPALWRACQSFLKLVKQHWLIMICHVTQSQDVQSAHIFVVTLTCLGKKHNVFVKFFPGGH